LSLESKESVKLGGALTEILVEMGGFCEQEVRSHFWLWVSEKTLWVTKHTFII